MQQGRYSRRDSSRNKHRNLVENLKNSFRKIRERQEVHSVKGCPVLNHLIDRCLAYSSERIRSSFGDTSRQDTFLYTTEQRRIKLKAILEGINRRNTSNTHQFPVWHLDKVVASLNSTRDNPILRLVQNNICILSQSS